MVSNGWLCGVCLVFVFWGIDGFVECFWVFGKVANVLKMLVFPSCWAFLGVLWVPPPLILVWCLCVSCFVFLQFWFSGLFLFCFVSVCVYWSVFSVVFVSFYFVFCLFVLGLLLFVLVFFVFFVLLDLFVYFVSVFFVFFFVGGGGGMFLFSCVRWSVFGDCMFLFLCFVLFFGGPCNASVCLV